MQMKLQFKNVMAMLAVVTALSFMMSCQSSRDKMSVKEPVDYVNPYMGNISHLLVPTFPTIHMPNSMLRVYPERLDYTGDRLGGLPVIVTSHRGASAFNLSPFQGSPDDIRSKIHFSYDFEQVTPYSYAVYLDEQETYVNYGLSRQSAIYEFDFTRDDDIYIIVNSTTGYLQWDGHAVSGYQTIVSEMRGNKTQVYVSMVPDVMPEEVYILTRDGIVPGHEARGDNAGLALRYSGDQKNLVVRYGVSFIDSDQAQRNLEREVANATIEDLHKKGRALWNDKLGKIRVTGGSEDEKMVLYSSLYRTYERPICISEDGRYFSGFDGQVHDDFGIPFYTDDWIWDTYRATHPLRVLIEAEMETDILNSYLRMAEQMDHFWMPTFPEVTGDSRRMNSNHGVATVIDAYRKGLRGFDLEQAYYACRNAITEKTLAPWSAEPAGELDRFYVEHGYIPALHPGEEETIPEVNHHERRQPVPVTLGTAYNEWCLAQIALELGKEDDYNYFIERAYNYRNLFHPETHFFHPRDANGEFIMPFDYIRSGGQGARDYYGENNAWVYRWDVQHNIADLIDLMGGRENFIQNKEDMYSEPLGVGHMKFHFFCQLPDHSGNVGQFSMANEPSLHIPYLYNYAGAPWRTQKRIRTLMDQWFRNDLMGIPGDEDGGGMSAFVIFSQLGFYPVTPGLPMYNIGSPFFEEAVVTLSNGAEFKIVAENYHPDHKYIQSVKFNGVEWNQPWFSHNDIKDGGLLEVVMGKYANKQWGASEDAAPPSFASSF